MLNKLTMKLYYCHAKLLIKAIHKIESNMVKSDNRKQEYVDKLNNDVLPHLNQKEFYRLGNEMGYIEKLDKIQK